MEHLQGDTRALRHCDEAVAQSSQSNAHAAGSGEADAAQQVHRDDHDDQRVDIHAKDRVRKVVEGRGLLHDRTEAHDSCRDEGDLQRLDSAFIQLADHLLEGDLAQSDDDVDDDAGGQGDGGVHGKRVQHDDDGDQGQERQHLIQLGQVIQIFQLGVRVFRPADPLLDHLLFPEVHPNNAEAQEEDRGNNAQHGSRHRRSAEIARGDQVLDLGRARQSRHGKGIAADCVGAGEQLTGNIGIPEGRRGDGPHNEHHDEQGNAAVGHDGAGQDHSQHRAFLAHQLDHDLADGVGCAGHFHQLSEDAAQQEHHQVSLGEISESAHIGLAEGREAVKSVRKRNDQCADRSRPKRREVFQTEIT